MREVMQMPKVQSKKELFTLKSKNKFIRTTVSQNNLWYALWHKSQLRLGGTSTIILCHNQATPDYAYRFYASEL